VKANEKVATAVKAKSIFFIIKSLMGIKFQLFLKYC